MQLVLPNKNASGELGPICNNCGGYGFTLGIVGKDNGCHYCNQTGIAHPTTRTLENRITQLEIELQNLKNIILRSLKSK